MVKRWPLVLQKISEKTRDGHKNGLRPIGIKHKSKLSFQNDVLNEFN